MASILDADTHIAEPPEMWDFLDPEWRARRPVIVNVPEDTLYGGADHMWLIDGNIFPKAAGKGGNRLVTPSAQKNIRDRVDIKARELLDLPCATRTWKPPAWTPRLFIRRYFWPF